MRAAKSRKKVIKRDFVRNVYRGEPQRHFLALCAEQVVGADAEVEQVARCDSRRIRIVVRSTVCRNTHAQGTAIRRGARQDWGCWCRESAAAEQSDLCLLVRGEAQRGGKVRYAAGHQTAIVAPGKIHVRREFLPVLELILHLRCLFEVLIVIDAKDTGWQVGIES